MTRNFYPIRRQYGAEYSALNNAIHRCHNPKNIAYKNYGARGIEVCPTWRNIQTGFDDFIKHIGPRPSDKHSLDRIDNNKGYEHGNVRWTDRKTQQNNRRHPKTYATDFGWGIGLSKPVAGTSAKNLRRPSALLPAFGKAQTVADWSRELGIPTPTIRQRLERGMTPESALTTSHLRGHAGDAATFRTDSKTLLNMGFPALVSRMNRVEATMMDRTDPARVDDLEKRLDDAIEQFTKSIEELRSRQNNGDNDAR